MDRRQILHLDVLFLSNRSEDDYSEEEDDEEEEEYDGEIPQPELEPRSRRCLIGDAGVCFLPGENGSEGEEEEEEDEEDDEGEHHMHGDDSDSDGPVLHKDEDSDEDEEDEPPPSKRNGSPERLSAAVERLHRGLRLSCRCPGQQSEEEGHSGSEAGQPSVCA